MIFQKFSSKAQMKNVAVVIFGALAHEMKPYGLNNLNVVKGLRDKFRVSRLNS